MLWQTKRSRLKYSDVRRGESNVWLGCIRGYERLAASSGGGDTYAPPRVYRIYVK